MKKQNLLIVPLDTLLALPCLTDSQAGKLFKAILHYRVHRIALQIDPHMSLVFQHIMEDMDKILDHQSKVSTARSASGQKGGRPVAEQTDPPEPTADPPAFPEYDDFYQYLKTECKYIYKKMQPMTHEQFHDLLGKFPLDHMKKVARSLENDKKYRSKYTFLYDTLLDWCTRQSVEVPPADPSPDSTPPVPEQPVDVRRKTDEKSAKEGFISMLKKDAAKGNKDAIEKLKTLGL